MLKAFAKYKLAPDVPFSNQKSKAKQHWHLKWVCVACKRSVPQQQYSYWTQQTSQAEDLYLLEAVDGTNYIK